MTAGIVVTLLALAGVLPFVIKRPFIGLMVYICLDFWRPQDFFPGVGVVRPVLIVALITVLAAFWRERWGVLLPWRRALPFLALLAVAVFSALLSDMRTLALAGVWGLAKTIVMVWMILLLVRSRREVTITIVVMICSLGALAIWGTVQGLLSGVLQIPSPTLVRVAGPETGLVGDPNDYARALVMSVPLWWIFWTRTQPAWVRVVTTIGLALTFAAIGYTYSRTGFVALGGVTTLLVMSYRPRWRSALILAAVFVYLISIAPREYRDRMKTILDVLVAHEQATADQVTESARPDLRIEEHGSVDDPTLDPSWDPTAAFFSSCDLNREIHIAVNGSNRPGTTGTVQEPFASLEGAIRNDIDQIGVVPPGTTYRIHAGTYAPTYVNVPELRGTRDNPICIVGAQGEQPPLLQGVGYRSILVFPKAQYLIIRGLRLGISATHGISIDDGGLYDTSLAHHIIIDDVSVANIQGDCLKFAGVDDIVVHGSRFENCGSAGYGTGINLVGCHGVLIAASTFNDAEANSAVQIISGCDDVDVLGNRITDFGHRAFTLGTSGDGLTYRRPQPSSVGRYAEISNIRVLSNTVTGGYATLSLAGCVDCLIANNTFRDATLSTLQVGPSPIGTPHVTFLPSTRVRLVNNQFTHGGAVDRSVLAEEEFHPLQGRFTIWSVAMMMVADRPIVGIGTGTFTEHYLEYNPTAVQPRAPHNIFLEVAAEMGLPGLFAYLWVVLQSLLGLHRVRRRARGSGNVGWIERFSYGLEVSLLGFLIAGMALGSALSSHTFAILSLSIALESTSSRLLGKKEDAPHGLPKEVL